MNVQLKTLLIAENDYGKIQKTISDALQHFKNKLTQAEKKHNQFEMDIYAREIIVTENLSKKLTFLYEANQLTYRALTYNLEIYQTQLLHTNRVKSFFCNFLNINHSTNTANKIKSHVYTLEKREQKLLSQQIKGR